MTSLVLQVSLLLVNLENQKDYLLLLMLINLCDLWGLALIQSWNNYKYCVSFVDDCTRFMWYYPLRNKAEFFQMYLLFEKMIYT